MRRDHARVARVKLSFEALRLQPVEDRIDSSSDDEHRACLTLGEEVSHRAVERTRHPHRLARFRKQSEGTLNLTHCRLRLLKKQLARLIVRQVIDLVCFRVGQINDTFDILVHSQPQT